MPADNRDRGIVEHILRYCEQIETAHIYVPDLHIFLSCTVTLPAKISILSRMKSLLFADDLL